MQVVSFVHFLLHFINLLQILFLANNLLQILLGKCRWYVLFYTQRLHSRMNLRYQACVSNLLY